MIETGRLDSGWETFEFIRNGSLRSIQDNHNDGGFQANTRCQKVGSVFGIGLNDRADSETAESVVTLAIRLRCLIHLLALRAYIHGSDVDSVGDSTPGAETPFDSPMSVSASFRSSSSVSLRYHLGESEKKSAADLLAFSNWSLAACS